MKMMGMLPRSEMLIDEISVNERVERFTKRSLKNGTKQLFLQLALSMVDLTTLEGKDTPAKVVQLCAKATRPHDLLPDLPAVAAVCVYPPMIAIAKRALDGSGVKTAAVSTYFPSGMSSTKLKIQETKYAIDQGADEIDMVISRGRFLSGEYNFVFDEIASIKSACGKTHLKVILETGELGTLDNVYKASKLAISAGADFIKTSTGKIQPAATLPVTLVMLEAIKEHYYATGKKVGMKPAGGIASSKLALNYLVMVNETLGSDWMSPDLFRFGASSLVNDLLLQIVKQKEGIYGARDYFSID
ncbi:MAG TPA: deoxyribose-phosphate aldolase [Bacteroidia bacterium]|nr:deoxyribose-phosphate aldolase [Bacteroidia bacterium]